MQILNSKIICSRRMANLPIQDCIQPKWERDDICYHWFRSGLQPSWPKGCHVEKIMTLKFLKQSKKFQKKSVWSERFLNKISRSMYLSNISVKWPEIAGSPVKVCSVGTAWLDLVLFRQFLPNIGIFIQFSAVLAIFEKIHIQIWQHCEIW